MPRAWWRSQGSLRPLISQHITHIRGRSRAQTVTLTRLSRPLSRPALPMLSAWISQADKARLLPTQAALIAQPRAAVTLVRTSRSHLQQPQLRAIHSSDGQDAI